MKYQLNIKYIAFKGELETDVLLQTTVVMSEEFKDRLEELVEEFKPLMVKEANWPLDQPDDVDINTVCFSITALD